MGCYVLNVDPEIVFEHSAQNPHSQLWAAVISQAIKDQDQDYFYSKDFELHAKLAGIDSRTFKDLILHPRDQVYQTNER